MKKIVRLIILSLVLAAFLPGTFLFAQSVSSKYQESSYYYFNFSIEKIYTHRLGFMVLYRANSNKVARTFIPHEWFGDIGGVGELVYLRSGSEWPSMVVYYKDGEFSHVRLRLRQNKLHETWGVIPFNVSADDYFQDLEEVKLEF